MPEDSQLKEITPDANSETAQATPLAAVERLLISFAESRFQEYARYRFAEEREWYESALFYQRRQWLKWNDSSRKWSVIKQNPNKPKPMPVTNYFAKAINDNANQLQPPKMIVTSGDDSAPNRRSAEYAEKSLPALDKESGFDVLCPLLAKHVVLWGIGCTKDIFDTSASAGSTVIPTPTLSAKMMLSCSDCGETSELTDQQAAGGQNATNLGTAAGNMGPDADQITPSLQSASPTGFDENPPDQPKQMNCPKCGGADTKQYPKLELKPAGSKKFTKGRLYSEVKPIFEIYLPRDCRNPNLAPCKIDRHRQSLGSLRRMYPDRAQNIKAEAPYDVHQIYMEALRALVNYNYLHEQTLESTTVTELWCKWDELPRRLQEKLEKLWADDSDQLDSAQNDGIFMVYAGGTMLAWGPNFMEGEDPYTFFLWELDPANVYPKGAAIDLTPLQKRLNRLDSLMELAMMCNGVGKWLWPATQNYKPPTGSPNEVIPYDVIGEGKVAPQFVSPVPFGPAAPQLRESIVQDFMRIGNTLGPAQGQNSGGQKSFRGAALLAAKQDEAVNTQRALWEKGHEIRYNKVLKMAAKWWDAPRKARVAGFNGKFGMMELKGDDLKGQYEIMAEADSSRPMTLSEKQQAFGMAAQGGLVDLTDPQTRDYVLNMLRLDNCNLADDLQFRKAERDLETIKQGQMPKPSPFQNPAIALKIFSNFTLTEEFEALPPQIQQGVIVYAQMASQLMQQAQQKAEQAALASAQAAESVSTTGQPHYIDPSKGGPNAQAFGKALVGGQKNPLGGVPGHDAGTGPVQHAAKKQGAAAVGAPA